MAKVKAKKVPADKRTKKQRRAVVFEAFEQVAGILGDLSAADRRVVLNLLNDWEAF